MKVTSEGCRIHKSKIHRYLRNNPGSQELLQRLCQGKIVAFNVKNYCLFSQQHWWRRV